MDVDDMYQVGETTPIDCSAPPVRRFGPHRTGETVVHANYLWMVERVFEQDVLANPEKMPAIRLSGSDQEINWIPQSALKYNDCE